MIAPPLPNALLGGAQKCGTTTLHRLLERHPGVFLPPRPQEIHFFDIERNFARGLGWYQRHFATWSDQPVVAQTSPLYLYEPKVPERVAAVAPEARWIFLLRNPVDRAYSHYWHEVRYGWEKLSFEEALQAEPQRLGGGEVARRHFSYLDRGRYASQLTRFVERFGRERVWVGSYDELTRDPAALVARVVSFLGLAPRAGDSSSFIERNHNPAMLPRFPRIQRWLRPWRGVPGLARLVDGLNLVEARYPAMREETRARLLQEMAGEAESLHRLVGLEVGHWFEANGGGPRR